jgi:hypothetical protein
VEPGPEEGVEAAEERARREASDSNSLLNPHSAEGPRRGEKVEQGKAV